MEVSVGTMFLVANWAVDDYALLLTFLYEVHIRVGDGDCNRYRLTRDGIFSVRTYLRSLLRPVESSFNWKIVWKCKLPPKLTLIMDGCQGIGVSGRYSRVVLYV